MRDTCPFCSQQIEQLGSPVMSSIVVFRGRCSGCGIHFLARIGRGHDGEWIATYVSSLPATQVLDQEDIEYIERKLKRYNRLYERWCYFREQQRDGDLFLRSEVLEHNTQYFYLARDKLVVAKFYCTALFKDGAGGGNEGLP